MNRKIPLGFVRIADCISGESQSETALMGLRWDDIGCKFGFITLRGDIARGQTESGSYPLQRAITIGYSCVTRGMMSFFQAVDPA